MTRQTLKQMAKEQIKGKIGILFVINLIAGILGSVLNFSFKAQVPAENFNGTVTTSFSTNIGAFLIVPAFTISLILIYLNLAKGVSPKVENVFAGFKMWWISVKTNFLTSLFTTLWALLFIVPGIVKSISYSMAMYIVAENPQISALEAINRSKEMMHGHKAEAFVLGLSFFGWILFGVVTLGIGLIWVIPYIDATYANYYNYIKECNGIVTETIEVLPEE